MRTLTSYVGACVALGLFATAANLQAIQKTKAAIAVPAGTEIKVRLTTPLDTGEAQAGQTFTGTLAEPVVAGGKTLMSNGATVRGKVVEAVSSGRLKRPASITLVLTTLSTEPLKIDGKSHLVRNVALIGGGTAAGAIIGGATGGKKGAAIGAAIGAGAGTATAFMTGKNEIALPAEMVLPFVTGSGAAAPTASVMPARTASSAPGPSGAYGDPDSKGTTQRAGEMVQVVFTSRDQELIQGYYGGGRGLPPGLAKKGKLPPGLAKQLRRNGSLPPGLQKKYNAQPFPADLERRLSPVPSGFSRVLISGRAVLMDRDHKILDLIAVIQ
jgi:hypothetical protein